MRKGFAPIIVILGIVALLALAEVLYFIRLKSGPLISKAPASQKITKSSPSPIALPLLDTVDWKVYSNTTLGYSIKYPPNWHMRVISEQWVDFSSNPFPASGPLLDLFSIRVNIGNQNMQQTLDFLRGQSSDTNNEEDVKISGVTARKFYYSWAEIYVLEKNGSLFKINVEQKVGEKTEEVTQILNTMLSTFNFTK